MKALILVGGFGTRLRPLTFKCPKPLVEFGNKSIVAHQIEALAKVAIAYQPELMKEKVDEFEQTYKVKITCSQETVPLGTAGPIRLAKDIIEKDNSSQIFFVFNSDVICEFPLQELLNFHKSHGKEGTILLTKVKDPSRFGVVLHKEDGQIYDFIEKPQEYIGNEINAGLYIFNTQMIQRIPLKPTSIEREIFPIMAIEGQLYSMSLQGFWHDIGQPIDFLQGGYQFLKSLNEKNAQVLQKGQNFVGHCLIDKDSKIHPKAIIGPDVIIGPNVTIEEGYYIQFYNQNNIIKGVKVQKSVILANCLIKSHSWISESIIGWNSTIGKWCRLEGLCVFGEDVQIKDELFCNGLIVLPHKGITSSSYKKGTIIM